MFTKWYIVEFTFILYSSTPENMASFTDLCRRKVMQSKYGIIYWSVLLESDTH